MCGWFVKRRTQFSTVAVEISEHGSGGLTHVNAVERISAACLRTHKLGLQDGPDVSEEVQPTVPIAHDQVKVVVAVNIPKRDIEAQETVRPGDVKWPAI